MITREADTEPIGVCEETGNAVLVDRLKQAVATRADLWAIPGQVDQGLLVELKVADVFRGPELGAGTTYVAGLFTFQEERLVELGARPILLVGREEVSWWLKQVIAMMQQAKGFQSTVRNCHASHYLMGLLSPFRLPWPPAWGGVKLPELCPWLDAEGKATGEVFYEGREAQRRLNRLEPSVLVNGKSLDPRTELVNHSPDGFQWGYGGSGPAQLALAILADALARHLGDAEQADMLAWEAYQAFKDRIVAQMVQGASWRLSLTVALDAWRLVTGQGVQPLEPQAKDRKGLHAVDP